jgi:hypothetical protein
MAHVYTQRVLEDLYDDRSTAEAVLKIKGVGFSDTCRGWFPQHALTYEGGVAIKIKRPLISVATRTTSRIHSITALKNSKTLIEFWNL